ncbi:hypothetical protein [Luteococcus sp. OSA5]|uniref:hypothetical protein n=1 Tax=Luteococcus sp. OSA5 TaxID=3401630 RepID=UPI003B42867B
MLAFFISLVLIVVVGLVAIAVVLVGMQGAFKERAPEMAERLATAARHMNGEAEPPQALVDMVTGQMDNVRAVQRDGGGLGAQLKAVKLPTRGGKSGEAAAAQPLAEQPVASQSVATTVAVDQAPAAAPEGPAPQQLATANG